MSKYFIVTDSGTQIAIKSITRLLVAPVVIYVDNQLIASFWKGSRFYISKAGLACGAHTLTLVGHLPQNSFLQPIVEHFRFKNDHYVEDHSNTQQRLRDFRAGDILVASDNENDDKTGYVGHSAIVINSHDLIESPGGHPAIRQESIQKFLKLHPAHAQYRPRSIELGEKAAAYARGYLAKYLENLKNGIQKPVFSYSYKAVIGLDDPWGLIYCSKLVWLSYYYGADYKFKNDYLWFSPEDLYERLRKDENFIEIYRSPKLKFLLDT
ncbi:hypothetical protein [Ammoniphilus sp. 3BR4]|uniref:hypothetical protein n=1 Tax=Ammoniphilus sp. 3BR4 TaxID=3158265 RepID=UPI0034657326